MHVGLQRHTPRPLWYRINPNIASNGILSTLTPTNRAVVNGRRADKSLPSVSDDVKSVLSDLANDFHECPLGHE